MPETFWILTSGFVVAWLVIGGYVFTIARRQADVERDIARVRAELGEREQ